MDSEPKYITFPYQKSKIDVYDAFCKLLGQHDVGGTLYWGGASVQGTIAAMAMAYPHNGVNVIDTKTFKVLLSYKLPDGGDARVALSKDTLTLGVGFNTGV